MTKISAVLAIAFGLFLAVAEIARNWNDWSHTASWVVDYIAVALLLIGAYRYFKTGQKTWLAAGWGFTTAMFYGSFFSHLARINEPDYAVADHRALTTIIGIMFAVAVIGLLLTLFGKEDYGWR